MASRELYTYAIVCEHAKLLISNMAITYSERNEFVQKTRHRTNKENIFQFSIIFSLVFVRLNYIAKPFF